MSRSATFATACRTLPVASAALLVTLAACSDSITAPSQRLAPDAPSADIIGVVGTPRIASVWVTLRVASVRDDSHGTGQRGTTVTFKTSAGATLTLADNSALDTDARDGFYRVSLPLANSYTATVVAVPQYYADLQPSKTVSAFVTPTLVSMGTIYVHRKPVVDVVLYLANTLALGQTVKVTGPNGFSQTYTDGTGTDGWFGGYYAKDGYINFELPVIGTYTFCAVTSPQLGWTAPCKTAVVSAYDASSVVMLTYQAVLVGPLL